MKNLKSTKQAVTSDDNVTCKAVNSCPGYLADSDGNIWSIKRGRKKRLCLWFGNHGYKMVTLAVSGHKVKKQVHRLVLEAFKGPCPEGMECLHKDGKRANNAITNLKWGTRLENVWDRKRHGTDNAGERHGHSKLTTVGVLAIRELYRRHPGRSGVNKFLCRWFSVSAAVVSEAAMGKAWRSVSE